MAQLVREGRFGELDEENLAEEIADLGNSERSAVKSQLSRMLMHLVKEHIQPERSGASWRASVVDARREISFKFKVESSPSLRHHLAKNLQTIHRRAVRDTLEEINLTEHAKDFDIPKECPVDSWTNCRKATLTPSAARGPEIRKFLHGRAAGCV